MAIPDEILSIFYKMKEGEYNSKIIPIIKDITKYNGGLSNILKNIDPEETPHSINHWFYAILYSEEDELIEVCQNIQSFSQKEEIWFFISCILSEPYNGWRKVERILNRMEKGFDFPKEAFRQMLGYECEYEDLQMMMRFCERLGLDESLEMLNDRCAIFDAITAYCERSHRREITPDR